MDDGPLLSRLVLRGIARARGVEFPTDAPTHRRTGAPGTVAHGLGHFGRGLSTVLAYGLRPTGGTWREAALRERADHPMETHLTCANPAPSP